MLGKIVIAAAAALGFAAAAEAQEAPNLVGTWTATMEGVMQGTESEHAEVPTGVLIGKMDWALEIERQEGWSFAGTWASSKASDPVVGMVRPDGALHMVDNDGIFTGALNGETEMEVCRSEVDAGSMMVHCGTLTRQP